MVLPVAVDAYLAVEPRVLDDASLAERLVDLEQAARRIAAAQADAVRAFDVRDVADAHGSPSAAWWLCDHTGVAERDARSLVSLGRTVETLPVMAAAFREGAITAAHVRLLAGAARTLDPSTVADGEGLLAESARRMDARRFAAVVRHWVASVASADFERDTQRRYDSRWLSLSPTYGGMVSVAGMLDPEAGTLVKQAIDSVAATAHADDGRTPDQRRADALAELVALALDHPGSPVTGGPRPEIVVHVPADALLDPAGPLAQVAGVGPVPRATLDRLGCDARWVRLLVDAAGVPLDLGRTRRDVPAGLRKFVALRDGGCRYPLCSRGPASCEAHHVTHWRHGGRTDADNLALLCRYHHHLVHERGHEMKLLPDATVRVTRPDGTTLTSQPRGPTTIPLL